MKKVLMLSSLLCSFVGAAFASPKEITSVETAFAFFQNHKIVVERYDDPNINNVSCYISRAVSGGLSGAIGFGEDPSRFSIACRAVGPFDAEYEKNFLKKDVVVFDAKTSPFFKSMNVTRSYDEGKNVLIYLVWSTGLVDGSPFSSISVVPMGVE